MHVASCLAAALHAAAISRRISVALARTVEAAAHAIRCPGVPPYESSHVLPTPHPDGGGLAACRVRTTASRPVGQAAMPNGRQESHRASRFPSRRHLWVRTPDGLD